MRIYTLICEEIDGSSKIGSGGGFESRFDDFYHETFSTLDSARNRLKELFTVAKNQPEFKDINFNEIELKMKEENTIYYDDDDGFEYYNAIDKYNSPMCYIHDNDYDYIFIAKIIESELK